MASPLAGGEERAVFHLSHISKVYRVGENEIHALREIDLELQPGEFVVLLGASGSGKSTLLNILGGLDRPTTGQVRYRDHELTAATAAELTRFRREHVGFVFQFYNLIPSLTAYENVALVTEIAESPMDADQALAMVDMSERRDHFPSQLSGGEQQRVAIARAIVKRPDVLLCDEPTGALDYPTGKAVLSVLERVNRELGTITQQVFDGFPRISAWRSALAARPSVREAVVEDYTDRFQAHLRQHGALIASAQAY